MSYVKAMKHACNIKKIKKMKNMYNGFDPLGPNKRRERPWLGGCWFEPGMEEKRAVFIKEWEEETARMLKENPALQII